MYGMEQLDTSIVSSKNASVFIGNPDFWKIKIYNTNYNIIYLHLKHNKEMRQYPLMLLLRFSSFFSYQ
jgi:hypothetical protein